MENCTIQPHLALFCLRIGRILFISYKFPIPGQRSHFVCVLPDLHFKKQNRTLTEAPVAGKNSSSLASCTSGYNSASTGHTHKYTPSKAMTIKSGIHSDDQIHSFHKSLSSVHRICLSHVDMQSLSCRNPHWFYWAENVAENIHNEIVVESLHQ